MKHVSPAIHWCVRLPEVLHIDPYVMINVTDGDDKENPVIQ